jgi:hypothetical protein
MNPGTAKLVLRLKRREAAARPVPLKALYVLSRPRDSGSRRPERITIQPLSGREAFMEMVRAAFNLFVDGKARLTTQFDQATQLAAAVPPRRLSYPRNFSLLPAVCDAVLADLSA